jgi:transcriptional regulator with XRE-family HTH domain
MSGSEMKMHTATSDDAGRQHLRKEAGAWLRERRLAAGLSQRELAERVDVGYYTFVSQIEAGRGRIPAERYAVWADALEMNAAEFVRSVLSFYEPSTYQILFPDDAAKR